MAPMRKILKPRPIQRICVYIVSYVPDSSVEAILLQPASKSVGPNVFNSKRFLHKHAETMIKQCAEMMTKHCEMHERTANDALSQASASLTGPAHTSEGMPISFMARCVATVPPRFFGRVCHKSFG